MGTLRQLFRFNWAWDMLSLLGLVVGIGILGGCGSGSKFVEVAVTVDTCPSGSTRTPIDHSTSNGGATPGQCYITQNYSGALLPTNYKICKNSAGTQINCAGNETCNSGSIRCQDPPTGPGTEGRKVCKTIWTQTSGQNGNCICGTNYN